MTHEAEIALVTGAGPGVGAAIALRQLYAVTGSRECWLWARAAPAAIREPPVAQEVGLRRYRAGFGYGMAAKAGISREAIDAIDRTLKAAVRAPTVVERFDEIGVVLTASTSPEAFRKYIDAETEGWDRVIKENGIKGE